MDNNNIRVIISTPIKNIISLDYGGLVFKVTSISKFLLYVWRNQTQRRHTWSCI